MDDIIFQPGDRVRVKREYAQIAEESPLLGVRHLKVCRPGANRQPGEVPIQWLGAIYYVPARYVEAD